MLNFDPKEIKEAELAALDDSCLPEEDADLDLDTTTHPAAAVRSTWTRTRRLPHLQAGVRITLGLEDDVHAAVADIVVYHHDDLAGALPDEIMGTATIALPALTYREEGIKRALVLAEMIAKAREEEGGCRGFYDTGHDISDLDGDELRARISELQTESERLWIRLAETGEC